MMHSADAKSLEHQDALDPLMAASRNKSVRTSVTLSQEAHDRVLAIAAANDVSAAWVIRKAILRFLDTSKGDTGLPVGLPRSNKVAV